MIKSELVPVAQKDAQPENFVGSREVAEFLGKPLCFVYEMSGPSMDSKRRLPSRKIGKFRFFRLSEVEQWIEAQAERD